MARIPSTESQRCSSIARGWDRRSFPVFFLYSLKATSKIDAGCKDEAVGWEGKDMVQLTRRLLVRIADWPE